MDNCTYDSSAPGNSVGNDGRGHSLPGPRSRRTVRGALGAITLLGVLVAATLLTVSAERVSAAFQTARPGVSLGGTSDVGGDGNRLTVHEGGSSTYTLELDTKPTGDVTVTPSSDTAGVTVSPATLTFTASNWNQPQSVTVAAAQDDHSADYEATVSHTVSGADYGSATAGDVTVSVANDDVPGVTISSTSLTVDEGDSSTYTVRLDSAPAPGGSYVTVYIESTDNEDVTLSTDELTFTSSNWNQPQSVKVSAAQDDDVEDDTATISHSVQEYYSVVADDVAVSVVDDDLPGLSISDGELPESEATQQMTFTVQIDPASDKTVTVRYATSAGTATAGADYTTTSGTLTFDPFETSKDIEVDVLGDSLDEDDETFTVTLSSPTNAMLSTATATGTITDNDSEPGLFILDASVTESEATRQMTFTVRLNRASSKTVTVNWATSDDTADSGSDYTAASGELTFQPGDRSKNVQVAVLGDALDEDDETFTVTLTGPVNAFLHGATATGTILDNDSEPGLSIGDASVTESEATQQMTFTVRLDRASSKTVTVNWATSDDTADSGSDYTAASGELTFPPGDRSKNVQVAVLGDALDEDDETFTVTLTGAVNATVSDSTATGKITDNDPTPALSFVGAPGTFAAKEQGRSIVFTVSLSAASGKTVTVNWQTSGGTATPDVDYVASSGTLTFEPGDTIGGFTVDGLDDSLDEDTETIGARLSSPANATLGQFTQTAGNIVDNDDPPSLSIGNADVIEPDGSATTQMTFTVSLSAASAKTVTVDWATSSESSDTATEGTDYTAGTGKLTFQPGETSKTFTVTVRGDDTDEAADETFTVTLTGNVNASLNVSTATGTITDNEGSPRLSVADADVIEGDSGPSTMTFTVTLLGDAASAVTADWATSSESSDTATEGTDYTAGTGALTFQSGETSKLLTVTVAGDVLNEDDETFTVMLTSPMNATLLDATATGTITDDDPLPRVSIGAATETEGQTVRFPVELSEASGRDVTVAYRTAPFLGSGTAAEAGTDYRAGDDTLTFTAGETQKHVEVATFDDIVRGSDEIHFDVLLSLPSDALAELVTGRARATGTILDDEPDPSFSIAAASGIEDNGTITFKVSLNNAVAHETTVQWRASSETGDTATAATDFETGSGTLTFEALSTTKTFTVAVADDSLDEAEETFTVTLSDPSEGATLGTAASATGTIFDDDDPPQASVEAAEGREGGRAITFKVTLSEQSGRAVTVNLTTTDGTATAGDDYAPLSAAPLTFDVGETSKTFPVTIIDDHIAELDETFTVSLTSADSTAGAGRRAAGAGRQATGTITDNEPRPRITITRASAFEDGNLGFEVTLAPQSAFEVRASWATEDGTATAGADYTAGSGALTFEAGATTKTITITVNDDNDDEADETLTVRLSSPVGATIGAAAATGTILDNDGTPRLVIGDAELAEGASSATATMTFTVASKGVATADITVDYATRDGTATGGTDYAAATGTLTFSLSGSETSKTIDVTVNGDDDREGDETFTVRLSNARMNGQALVILDAEATGTILDDEPGVSITPQSLSITEGRSGVYRVRLLTQPTTTVTVTVSSDNPDVGVTPASLEFTAGNWATAQNVVVFAGHDADTSQDVAGLTHAVTGYGALTGGPTVTVTVSDDDGGGRGPTQPIGPGGGGPGGGGPGGGAPRDPADEFSDLDESGVHTEAVMELVRDGVMVRTGCRRGRLCPNEPLLRWEMAVWMVRVLDGENPGRPNRSRFEDVRAGQWWAGHVERLARLRVTLGCSAEPRLYCPNDPVTRAQMASFLVRAFELAEADPAGFEDVADTGHDADIDALYATGVTLGCSDEPLLYCPQQPTTRAEMASFLTRALKLQDSG